LATDEQIAKMRQNYLGGNYGYGHAKQELFELIIEKYKQEREAFNNFMNNHELLEEKLMAGEEKARQIGRDVLNRVKKTLGYK
jgi:tryptophanyl-tRNA synthetase